jgi:hypothetical protein
MTNLIPFLRDVVSKVMPFSSTISYIHLKETEDGHLLAMASSSDGTVHLRSTSLVPIDMGGARACLGNLGYLSQVLMSDFLKDNKAQVTINTRERNDKSFVSSLQFIPNNRMETNYVTTDPFRASIVKPMKIDVADWPVTFILDDSGYREVAEFKKIHAAAPSVGNEDVLRVGYSDGAISIDFGEGGGIHTSTLHLDVEVMADNAKPLGVYLLSDQFLRALAQSQDSDKLIVVALSEKAIQFAMENPLTRHELILIRRKLRDD